MSRTYVKVIPTVALLLIAGFSVSAWLVYSTSLGTDYSKYTFPLWTIPEGSHMYTQLRVGDLNGDGLDDVVVTGDYSLEAVFQNRTGGFENRTQILPSGSWDGFVLEDLNGDGSLDICALNATHDGTYLVTLSNSGTGAFAVASQYLLGPIRHVFPYRSHGSDVPDVGVYLLGDHNHIVLLHNNGSGHLTPDVYLSLTARNILDVLAADLDGDNQDEIITVQDNGNLTVWSKSASSRQFSNVSRYLDTVQAKRSAWLVIADMNGDGIQDVGLASNIGASRGVLVFLSGDSINVEQPIIERYYDYTWLGALASDLDSDTDTDIVLCTQQTVLVMENSQSGQIGGEIKFTGFITPHSPSVIALAGHPSPALIVLAEHRGWYDLNLIDLVVFWREERGILP
ncbi:MAG: VCBS repeat-containing protein [Candidatus Thorarchaeota archaeon]|nr:VCBS repeat-containing protein [Candidatus Thorarchaeota archaeon]